MKHSLLLSLGILFLMAFCAPAQGQRNTTADEVDAYIAREKTKYQIPGLTIGVVKNGALVKAKGYGLASVEFDVPASERTIYQLFSVSKVFAGVAVMKLVEAGQLSLDSSLADFIANAPAAWREIKIRNLLNHTSGLPEVGANPKYACLPEDEKKELTAEKEIALLSELPLKFKPGERWSYHVSGYHLLSYIVEKVSHQTYAQFLQSRVFDPLLMNSTRFGGTEMAVIKGRASTSYSRMTGELTGWVYPFSQRDFPAAALNSSVPDLARFFIALDAGKVLLQPSLSELWSRTKLTDGTTKDYGLGWTVASYKGRTVVGHEGGGSIWVSYFPHDHLAVIVLSNLNGARADEIQYGIADFYLEQNK